MRIAILSDVHGNRVAFEAVLADLRFMSPDLIFHGGDLADAGSSPAEIVDQIRDLGWRGVAGNTDEMLFRPEPLVEFSNRTPALLPLVPALQEMASWSRQLLGSDRLAWLASLPTALQEGEVAPVHATPESLWRAPSPESSDEDLANAYSPLHSDVVAYRHIHRSYIRRVDDMLVVNTGSVSLSYDGDRRAAYLLLDGHEASIRRVEYDVERECQAVRSVGLPHADWIVRTLMSGALQPLA